MILPGTPLYVPSIHEPFEIRDAGDELILTHMQEDVVERFPRPIHYSFVLYAISRFRRRREHSELALRLLFPGGFTSCG